MPEWILGNGPLASLGLLRLRVVRCPLRRILLPLRLALRGWWSICSPVLDTGECAAAADVAGGMCSAHDRDHVARDGVFGGGCLVVVCEPGGGVAAVSGGEAFGSGCGGAGCAHEFTAARRRDRLSWTSRIRISCQR